MHHSSPIAATASNTPAEASARSASSAGSATSPQPGEHTSPAPAVSIVGAGGHGREIWGVLRAIAKASDTPLVRRGFYDDHTPDDEGRKVLERIGGQWLGKVSKTEGDYLIGIGAGEIRERVAAKLHRTSVFAVHPGAFLDEDVRLQPGAVIFASATVTTNIDVGYHSHVGRGAAVGHDSVLEDFVTVMPLASVSGNVHLGRGCTVGTGAVVRQGIRVGAGAFVGAGAVVVKDVPAGAVVVGNPAKPLERKA